MSTLSEKQLTALRVAVEQPLTREVGKTQLNVQGVAFSALRQSLRARELIDLDGAITDKGRAAIAPPVDQPPTP